MTKGVEMPAPWKPHDGFHRAFFPDTIYRRMFQPVRKLTRTPDLEGTTATFTGTFRLPARNVVP